MTTPPEPRFAWRARRAEYEQRSNYQWIVFGTALAGLISANFLVSVLGAAVGKLADRAGCGGAIRDAERAQCGLFRISACGGDRLGGGRGTRQQQLRDGTDGDADDQAEGVSHGEKIQVNA